MKIRCTAVSAAIAGAALLLAAGPGLAQTGMTDYDASVQCSAFQRSGHGAWTAVAPVTLDFGNFAIPIAPGRTFSPGSTTHGVEITAVLDRHCGNE